MANTNKDDDRQQGKDSASQTGGADSAGDPGRTPGAAEGDEQTVEEDLKDKESKGQI